MFSILPEACVDGIEDSVVNELAKTFESDLPSPKLLGEEVKRWRRHFMSESKATLADTPGSALKACSESFYPNITILLRIAATLPITSCECERSASSLRRLETYNRASMTEERRSSLALIHIHYNKEVSVDRVIDIFARLHPRKLEFENILGEKKL